jgi:hypothetical protein
VARGATKGQDTIVKTKCRSFPDDKPYTSMTRKLMGNFNSAAFKP